MFMPTIQVQFKTAYV